MEWIEESLKEVQEDLENARAEKKAFNEMVDGVYKISLGFAQIANFLKTTESPFDIRIEACERRIKDLEEKKKQEAEASQ